MPIFLLLRSHQKHTINNIELFQKKLLIWSQQFNDIVWLDSNGHNQKFSNYDAVLAVDAFTSIQTDYIGGFSNLKEYQSVTNDWIFGYLSYDLKNDVEQLQSNNFDKLEFPDLYFFQPKKLFLIKNNVVEIQYLKFVEDEMEDDLKQIKQINKSTNQPSDSDIKIKLRIHKDEYFEKIRSMQSHIHRGDIYEANFCQEFYSEKTTINPVETYLKLNDISNPPFATFLKCDDKYVMSASLERYLKKDGNTIISQPIKGTSKRSEHPDEDKRLIQNLLADEKERSENIMIVDLVRNDLSKLAIKGSVRVEELCEIYTFKQVHQMISTIVSEVEDSVNPVDIIKATFPMGSMTGAPKISAMKIIETLEETKRGVYSGAVGYFSPTGDFDFNVVIRSILYNETQQYVSYSVGGAITDKSDPLKEYEECLVKAKAMRTVLES